MVCGCDTIKCENVPGVLMLLESIACLCGLVLYLNANLKHAFPSILYAKNTRCRQKELML